MASENPLVKRLVIQLGSDDFTTAGGVTQLIDYLEDSPLGRLPVPDEGLKMGLYCRELQRRRGESVEDFLFREDRAFDEIRRTLGRPIEESTRGLRPAGDRTLPEEEEGEG